MTQCPRSFLEDDDAPAVEQARFSELDVATLYGLLRLRSDVFVVEQQICYLDLDERDREPETLHVWVADRGSVVSTLRVLLESDGAHRIGRVCTARSHRGLGLAERLIRFTCDRHPGEVVLQAQSYLQQWYERLGFVRDGADYVDDGILHTPMRLARSTP